MYIVRQRRNRSRRRSLHPPFWYRAVAAVTVGIMTWIPSPLPDGCLVARMAQETLTSCHPLHQTPSQGAAPAPLRSAPSPYPRLLSANFRHLRPPFSR